MKRSQLLLEFARRAPWAARGAHRVWAASYRVWPRPIHWFFEVLRTELDVRYTQKARLVTGQPILVDPFDQFIGRAILKRGCDEPETVALVRRLVRPGMVVLDIGANIGQYTLITAQLVGPKGQVHAFEPEPRTFRVLERNVRLNRLRNVRCNRLALAEAAGSAKLYLSPSSNTGGNSLGLTQGVTGRSVPITVKRLDDYTMETDLARCDLVKIDVEGAERSVLRGGRESLARFRPILIVETSVLSAAFGYHGADLRAELGAIGYGTFRIAQTPLLLYEPSGADPNTFNLLAVPLERVAVLAASGIVAAAAPAVGPEPA